MQSRESHFVTLQTPAMLAAAVVPPTTMAIKPSSKDELRGQERGKKVQRARAMSLILRKGPCHLLTAIIVLILFVTFMWPFLGPYVAFFGTFGDLFGTFWIWVMDPLALQ